GAGLILATFLAYAPAVGRIVWNHTPDPAAVVRTGPLQFLPSGFIWDDDAHVSNSPTIRDTSHGLHKIWFTFRNTPQHYPLATSWFRLKCRVFGQNAWCYPLVNIPLHGLSCVLVWRILRRLQVPGALLAAAIFALHPVEVESVAWITELKNILSGFFYL